MSAALAERRLEWIEMRRLLIRFRDCERGATAIEYGLMAGLIAVAIVIAVTGVGVELAANLQEIVDLFVLFRT